MKLPLAPKTTEGRYLAVALIFFLLLAVMTYMVWKTPDIAGIEDGSQQQIYWLIAGGCISGCVLIVSMVLLATVQPPGIHTPHYRRRHYG